MKLNTFILCHSDTTLTAQFYFVAVIFDFFFRHRNHGKRVGAIWKENNIKILRKKIINRTKQQKKTVMSASLSVSSFSSKNDNSFCRICYSFSSYDLIRVPCNCKNTIGYVHRNCLQRWIRAINNSFCEICQTEYPRNIVFPQRR